MYRNLMAAVGLITLIVLTARVGRLVQRSATSDNPEEPSA